MRNRSSVAEETLLSKLPKHTCCPRQRAPLVPLPLPPQRTGGLEGNSGTARGEGQRKSEVFRADVGAGRYPQVVLDVLTAADVRAWALLTRAAFAARRREIDDLNVYPVPDGDTGTNLYLTLDAALDAVAQEHDAGTGATSTGGTSTGETSRTLRQEAEAVGRAVLLSARGNSGVILSQIIRGIRDVVVERDLDVLAADDVAAMCERGAALARLGVAEPVEGTILTVADAASRGAREAADGGADLAGVVHAAARSAGEALLRTPEQLPALAAAGVVDAGGAGCVLMLEALHRVVLGEWDVRAERVVSGDQDGRRVGWSRAERPAGSSQVGQEAPVQRQRSEFDDALDRAPREVTGPAFEVMYLLEGTDESAVQTLRATLAPLGDSLLVVGGPDVWNVHVHVDDVGAAIEAGIIAGRPHRIAVTHFAEQVAAIRHRRDRTPDRVGVVACAAGPGIAVLMAAAGAQTVISGPGRRASAGQLLDAVRGTSAPVVLLLPNDKDTVMAAEAAAAAATNDGQQVHVIPARTAVQGLAAMAVFDPTLSVHHNVVSMTAAVTGTAHGAVTIASKEALTSGGHCHPGDALGIVGGDIVIVGDDLVVVATQVLDRLLNAGGELVSLVVGDQVPPGLVDAVRHHVHRGWPGAQVEVIDGGQPHYPLLVGVE